MHLPDGIMSGHAEIVAGVAVAGGLAVAARAAGAELRSLPTGRVAAVGALVFAGQMVNIPVATGTSGHLIGAALAVALLGPAVGVLTVAAVIVVQALAFADGGVSSLGLNVLNMAIVPALAAWWALRRTDGNLAIAAGLSVLAAATAFSVQYALAGLGEASAAAVAGQMLVVHLPIAALEVVLTLAAVAAIGRIDLRPGLVVVGALGVAAVVAPWASGSPDGLERVAIDRGFASLAGSHPLDGSPVADYLLRGVAAEPLAVALAGIAGVAMILAVLGSAERLLRRT